MGHAAWFKRIGDREKIVGWSILLISIIFCFAGLSLKPPHSDESGNGFFVNQIWDNGFYQYDPHNYHGPLLFYLLQISEKVFGFGIGSFRAVTALFSVLSVWLVVRNRGSLGQYASTLAALALAVSPGMTFFGRSAIHESAFVFFQILLVTGFLETMESGGRQGVAWSFAGLLGCMLMKETFVILVFSLFIAWVWTSLFPRIKGPSPVDKTGRQDRRSKSRPSHKGRSVQEAGSAIRGITPRELPPGLRLRDLDRPLLVKLAFVCGFVWLALFTGFFHRWRGAADFFTALVPWLKTGVGGSGHDKPFAYWLRLMGTYEWAAAIGLGGAFFGLINGAWKLRFFSAMGIVNWLIYSLISYKTPWCIISILWPLVVVAGLWAEALLSRRRNDAVSWAVLFVGAFVVGQSTVTNVRLNFFHYTDPAEAYVYVQTKNDVKLIEDIIRKKIDMSPDARNMTVQINLKDSWPFPWLFSRFPNVGYGDYRQAFKEQADVIFAELSHEDRDLDDTYLKRSIDVRDARDPINIYLKKSVFQGMDLPGFGPAGSSGNRT